MADIISLLAETQIRCLCGSNMDFRLQTCLLVKNRDCHCHGAQAFEVFFLAQHGGQKIMKGK